MVGDSPWVFYVSWVPLLLAEQYRLSLKEIGALAWVPFLFADLGSLGGGWLSGLFVRRGRSPVQARLLVMACSACVLAFTFSLGRASSTPVIIGLLSLMTLFTMAWMVNLSTIPVDAFPNGLVGRVVGLTTAAAVLGQLLLTSVIGYCFDHRLYQTPFVIMSFMAPAAYAVIRLILAKQTFRASLELLKP
jgi:ACS family hexuronate transporter-like MFS transporter